MENKTNLRTYAKSLRKTLNIENKSTNLVKKIRELPCYKSAQNVMLFYPTKFEINLLPLLKDNKKFYFPKVEGKALLVCPHCDKYEKSSFNIMEPCSKPVNTDILDLVIVPALMADKEGYRLGYGGGFYDRFLATLKIKTLTALPKELVIEKLPRDEFDIPIDNVITM